MGVAPSSPEEEGTAHSSGQAPPVSLHNLLVSQTGEEQSSKPLRLLKQAIQHELDSLLAKNDFSLQGLNAKTVSVHRLGDATKYQVEAPACVNSSKSASQLDQAVRRILRFQGGRADGAAPLLKDVQAWTVLFYLCGRFWWQLAATEQKQRFERQLRNAIADDVKGENRQARQWALLAHIGYRLAALAIALAEERVDDEGDGLSKSLWGTEGQQTDQEAPLSESGGSDVGERSEGRRATRAESFLLQASAVLARLPTKPPEYTVKLNERTDGAREWLEYVGEAIRLRDAVSLCTSCGKQVHASLQRHKQRGIDKQ